MNKDLRGTWTQALLTFFAPIFLVVGVRWLLVEPFVIPSGSMLPSLLIHDHIFVNKLAFGVQVPFGNDFLIKWGKPQPGQIVVFRFPSNPDVFYIKRVIAIGGDEVSVHEGVISVNGIEYPQQPLPSSGYEEGFDYFQETSQASYIVRYLNKESSFNTAQKVPANHFFVMGDNRDQSNDSRFWGFVPESNLVGKAQMIWLSCEETLVSAQFLCDPSTIRWHRLLKKAQ
ncbi:MAG: signal peptidase I [Pseudobdellovibrionaceae bacterium]